MIAIVGSPDFDVTRAGKKAGNLHLMAAAGFAVPAGFVVPPEEAMEGVPDAVLAGLVARVGGFPVAVRSSGLLEDLAGASFAGQYETFLDVADVPSLRARIDECRASGKSDRVRAYLEKKGLDPSRALVSVLVQRMVDARVAGVGFSIHPVTGREEHALVECVTGLGEKLVSGHASPSRYVLDLQKGTVVEAEPGPDGAELSTAEAREVARALLDLQAQFHAPQDVEFAVDRAGKLWLLQSRPITRIQWRTDVDELTNADFKDGGISARVCTPMMYSLYRDAFQGSMQRYFETIKLVEPGKIERWIASYYGRGYWNASAVKRALAKVPGFREEKFDQDLGIQKDYGARGPLVVPTNARTVLRAIPIAIALEREYRRQLRVVARFGGRFRRERRKWTGRISAFARTSDGVFFADLGLAIRELHLRTEEAYFTTIYNNQNTQSDFKGAIAKMDAATGRPTQLVLLMSGLDGIQHMDVQRGFVELHRVAKAHGVGLAGVVARAHELPRRARLPRRRRARAHLPPLERGLFARARARGELARARASSRLTRTARWPRSAGSSTTRCARSRSGSRRSSRGVCGSQASGRSSIARADTSRRGRRCASTRRRSTPSSAPTSSRRASGSPRAGTSPPRTTCSCSTARR